ncbi:DUF6053 domain-containing protein [Lysobacter yananisis]|uniref:DUF6053 domain-containing protein n=1 Tax=Lysobacter yananisis TaxID=1003114 RepID=UPI003CE4D5CC
MGGPSGPMLLCPIAAIRAKGIGPEGPPTKKQARRPSRSDLLQFQREHPGLALVEGFAPDPVALQVFLAHRHAPDHLRPRLGHARADDGEVAEQADGLELGHVGLVLAPDLVDGVGVELAQRQHFAPVRQRIDALHPEKAPGAVAARISADVAFGQARIHGRSRRGGGAMFGDCGGQDRVANLARFATRAQRRGRPGAGAIAATSAAGDCAHART